MIDSVRRKIAIHRRAVARGPLDQLLRWAGWHAMQPLAGSALTEEAMTEARRAVERKLAEMANAGVFLFFGIASSFQLGKPPVMLLVVHPSGAVVVDTGALLPWIMAGGAAGRGWARASDLTIDQLS
jgi:hypothetical protein